MDKSLFARIISCFLAGSIITGVLTSSSSKSLAQPSQLDGPERTVYNFHEALQQGDLNTLNTYFCAAERASAQIAERTADSEGQNRALLNAYLQIAYTMYSVDMSRLQYETVYTDAVGEGRAVVTVVGPVAVESSDGRGVLVPYRNFSALGREWLRLIRENGEWKLCQNLNV